MIIKKLLNNTFIQGFVTGCVLILLGIAGLMLIARSPISDIHKAVNNRDFRLIKEDFIDHINNVDVEWNESALHIAISNNDLEMVKCLIDLGAEINQMGWTEDTPLDLASTLKYKDIILYLKSKRAKHFYEL